MPLNPEPKDHISAMAHAESLHLLRLLLSCLRAQYLNYQNAHWMTVGDSAYGTHLLFQRIYEGDEENDADEGIQGQVDGLAEKMVGKYGPDAVNGLILAQMVAMWIQRWSVIDCHHRRALKSEDDMQALTKQVYDRMKANGSLSLGMDDFLMSLASEHETNQYLVQQVLRRPDNMKAAWDAGAPPTLDEAWAKQAWGPGDGGEMTPLEKTWSGYSSFAPIRKGEGDDEHECDCGPDCDCPDHGDADASDESYFHNAPHFHQLQRWQQGMEPQHDADEPFWGWTISNGGE